jgi:uncharacterized protein
MTDKDLPNDNAWDSLKEKLLKTTKWPSIYMFKFIVKSDNQSVAKVQALFNSELAQIDSRTSRNGNYVSITAKEVIISADAVIAKYKEASEIEGVMSF